MRALTIAILAFATLWMASPAEASKATLVYKVDSATAQIRHHHLVITAKGAVRTGGWERPHLHVKEVYVPEADTVVVEFLAVPPPKDQIVAQAILPVEAVAKTGLPHYGATQVKVVAETNSIVVPIRVAP